MHKSVKTSRLRQATRLVWGLLLFTVPVTTFRYIPDFMGRTLVQPLAIYPLALLLLLFGAQFLRARGFTLPSNTQLLLAFLMAAVIVSAIGALYTPLPLRGSAYEDRVLRGWFSLLIGLLFFIVSYWMNRSEADLDFTLKWIYASLVLTILWSLVQAISINTSLIPHSLVNQIQLSFSARPLLARRVSGFAYEPAWLADQIIIFYLPWLFAAILRRRPRFGFAWLEPLLFLLSLGVLIFSYSRGGLLAAFVCILLVFFIFGRGPLTGAWNWFTAVFRSRVKSVSALALRVGLIAAVLIGLVAAFSFLSRYQYFANIWELEGDESAVDYLVDISAGPRLAYAVAGYQTYADAPLTGVGLGASSMYLYQRLPEWSSGLPEIARQLSPDSNQIPNIKNFYLRLLAEVGLPGFWFFVVFLLSFLAMIRRMAMSNKAFLLFVAVGALFAWLAIFIRNFTQDSFTFPIMWVILGILAGLYPVHQKEFRLRRYK